MGVDSREIGLALALEVTPASLFAASVGFALFSAAGQPLLLSALAATVAFLLAWALLRRLGASEDAPMELAHFDLDDLEPEDFAEPVDDSEPESANTGEQPQIAIDELLLDDVLTDLPAESRVVSLFQPQAAPTAGELQAQIDRHLRCGTPAMMLPDATQELHEALDALRRSLR